jgi:hypothetical protein
LGSYNSSLGMSLYGNGAGECCLSFFLVDISLTLLMQVEAGSPDVLLTTT